MFRACNLGKRLNLTSYFKTHCFSVRRIVEKKAKNPLEFFNPPSYEKYRKSRFVPEGYELVYLNKNLHILNLGHLTLIALYGTAASVLYRQYKDPYFLADIFGEGEAIGVVALVLLIIFIQASVTRSVRLIVRKDKEFQSIFYGSFGFLRTKVVNHKAQECLGPKNVNDWFHYLKNKRIILDIDSFINLNDYADMVRFKQEIS